MVALQFQVFWIIVIMAVYFIPTFIAKGRRHKDGRAIFWLNLLLGWTLLGWIGAFIWSNTGNVDHKVLPPA